MSSILSTLPINEMMAVVQLGYQLIRSAKQATLSEDDNPSIDYIIETIGLANDSYMGNLIWNTAISDMNPFSAFDIVSRFSLEKKKAFKYMIQGLCSPDLIGYTEIRIIRFDIARQIFERTGCVHL